MQVRSTVYAPLKGFADRNGMPIAVATEVALGHFLSLSDRAQRRAITEQYDPNRPGRGRPGKQHHTSSPE